MSSKRAKSRFRRTCKSKCMRSSKSTLDLRWDDAVKLVLGDQLDAVRAEKQKAKKKSGDFTDADEDEGDGDGAG